MTDMLCTWCRRTEADHGIVTGHAFALRCAAQFDTGDDHRPVRLIACMREADHGGDHRNGTRSWSD